MEAINPEKKAYVIGLDMDGTNSVFGIVDSRGTIKAQTVISTEATKTYLADDWQYGYSAKQRVRHMMDAYGDKVHLVQFGTSYRPVMSEMEALECLQAGAFAIEAPGNATNWSCIYNSAQKTILFNMRNDMSHIYKIDFNKDF